MITVLIYVAAAILIIAFLVVWIILLLTARSRNTVPEPKFTAFSVTPEVCANTTGGGWVQIAYTVDPDGWSNSNTLATRLTANSQSLHPSLYHAYFVQGEDGNKSLAFNVNTHYGVTVPTTIDIVASLFASQNANDPIETRAGTVSVRSDCSEPEPFPG